MRRTARLSLILWAIILIGASTAAVVWGSDVTTSLWQAKATLSNVAVNDVTNEIFPVPVDFQALVDNAFINSTGLNFDIHDSAGSDVPFAPGSLITRIEGAHLDDGGVFTDETADANDAGVTDVILLPPSPVANDAFYFIADNPFRTLRINVDGLATCTTPVTIAWEYSDLAIGYTALQGVQDGTAAFSILGTNTVSFDIPIGFFEALTNGTTGFTVRARVTAGVCSTSPTASQIWYATGVAWVFEDDLASGSTLTHDIFAGGSTDQRTTHRIIPGDGGMTISDDAALEPGSNRIDLEIKGYWDFDASTGTANDVMDKGADIEIAKDTINDGELNASFVMTGFDCNLFATGLTNGVHTMLWEVRPGAGTCRLLVDTVETVVDSAVSGQINDNAQDFEIANHEVLNYVDFFKYSLTNTLIVHYEPATLQDGFTISDLEGTAQDATIALPGFDDGAWNEAHTVVLAPFVTAIDIDSSPNAGAGSDVVSDVGGSAEGTGFAGVSAPSSGLPGYTFLNDIAGKDYDPVTGGVQGIPISFFYIIIAAAILIATLVGVLVMTRSLLFAGAAVGLMAALMVSVTIISPWYLMWLAIPMTLWFLVRGGLDF